MGLVTERSDQKKVLDALASGPLSRAGIMKRTNLNTARVSRAMQALMAAERIRRETSTQYRRVA